MTETTQLVLRQPDDWHVHLRDDAMLGAVANYTANQFARAIVMPNLSPPVTTVDAAVAYRDRIIAAVDPALGFMPLMTAYLTDSSDGAELARGHGDGVFTAAKLYPAHATTNSSFGVTDIRALYPALEAMQRAGMPLLVHGEVTDRDIDIFDREAVFIERVLAPLLIDFPGLK
ncbi:MAG: amidohydrolase family protein, partial [Polymorphobacter sp.]